MRLVADAVRDVMLYVEQNQNAQYDHTGVFELKSLSPKHILDDLGETNRYTREEAEYALRLLYAEKFLLGKHSTGKNGRITTLTITGISYEGHQFLDSIRNNTVWNKVKNQTCKLGITGIKELYHICKTVIGKMIEDPELFSNILSELKN